MYEGVTDLGNEFCRVVFNEFEMNARATATNPFIPNIEELKQAIVRYCQDFIPSLLECKVEAYLHQRGHKILWTPPYCPDLQPIELYWAAGKNHAAMMNHSGIKMKEVVRHLREGWYGNIRDDGVVVETEDDDEVSLDSQDGLPIIPYDHIEKKEVDCHALFRHAIDQANTKFIPMCVGISGTIGELVVDADHIANKENLPIDMFVLDITEGMEFEGEDVPDDVVDAVEDDGVNENSHANLIAESFSL